MINALFDLVRRVTGQSPAATGGDAAWQKEFETVFNRSQAHPRDLVEFTRLGIPHTQRGMAWRRILRIQEVPSRLVFGAASSLAYLRDFDREMMRIFGTLEPENLQAPNFGSPLDFVKVNVSAARRETIRKLLCIIGDTYPQLEYVPIIPAVVAILVRYMSENDVLACMAAMLEGHSIPASKRQEWAYFPLHRRDYLVFRRVFEDLARNFAPKVMKHILHIQSAAPDCVLEWDAVLSGIFIGILPRELIMRIFDCYLVEGYKIILRFAIAHVMIRQDRILKAKSGAEIGEVLALPETSPLPEMVDFYFRVAMSVKFDRSIIHRYRNRRRKHSVDDFDTADKQVIFHRPMPQIHRTSSFVREQDWAVLWSWIPARYRLLALDLAYTSVEHGKHLKNLLSKCAGSEPAILLIETVSGHFLGAYVSKGITAENGPAFYGTGETFLFTLRPKTAKYEWNVRSNSTSYICVTDDFVGFGGGKEFGLQFDRFLVQLTSAPSVTFANPTLTGPTNDDLYIYRMEVFRFV